MTKLPQTHPALLEHERARTKQQKVADAITNFAGSMAFVYVHALLFASWIISKGFGFDKYPFNFLTMTVSLEAIFLSTFVMIGQNSSADRDRLVLEHDAATTDDTKALVCEVLQRVKQLEG